MGILEQNIRTEGSDFAKVASIRLVGLYAVESMRKRGESKLLIASPCSSDSSQH